MLLFFFNFKYSLYKKAINKMRVTSNNRNKLHKIIRKIFIHPKLYIKYV